MNKVTLQDLRAMKDRGEPIAMLTAYDYPTAQLLDRSGIDMILVGDSLGMVVHGMPNTLGVTLDMMVMHCQAVRRGVERAFVVGDLPFMTYQPSRKTALRSAGRLLSAGGVDAVKLEGGRPVLDTVRTLVEAGIAVQGHLGLTPQSVSALGGFKVQARTLDMARQLIEDAQMLEEAGAFSIVLEAIPDRLAALVTRKISIPTIGIGAGAGCDGQVLVTHDLIGFFDQFTPKFVRQYANLTEVLSQAFRAYRADVQARKFPASDHSFSMPDDIWSVLEAEFTEIKP